MTSETIREGWNVIPGVKPCKKLGKTIGDRIQARLNEYPSQDWWTELLQQVRASDFLCGRTNGSKGPFHASLDWILGPKILDKLLAGNYDPMTSNGHDPNQTCTKRIQAAGDRFLRACGQPVSPQSGLTEPRCAEHAAGAAQKEIHAYH